MKSAITLILITGLLLIPMQDSFGGGRKKATPQVQEGSLALAALVLTVAAVAAYVVIKVHSNHKQFKGPVTLVLEKSGDNVNWVAVATNRVVLNGEDPMEVFREVRKDGHSFYRARVQ